MTKANPAATLAQNMIQCLASRRETNPADYMLSLQDLIDEARDQADDETVKKALAHKDFKGRAVVADPKDSRSPVALQEDLPKLAESSQLLDYLKTRVTPIDGQRYLLSDLKKGIVGGGKASELKKAFESAIQIKIETGEIYDVALKKTKPKKPDPAKELAEQMLAQLEKRRESNPNDYIISIRELAEQVNTTASAELRTKAMGRKEFKNRIIVANAKDDRSPIALQEDLPKLAESLQLLDYVQARSMPFDGQHYLLSDLHKGIAGGGKASELKKAFEAAMRRKIEDQSVGSVLLKKPPKPKLTKAEKEALLAEKAALLAENLIKVLASQRPLGADAYPLTLRQLAQYAEADPSQDKQLIIEATRSAYFKQRALVVWDKDLESPTALAEDAEQLAALPKVFEYALRSSRDVKKSKFAHTAETLAKKISDGPKGRLGSAFVAAIQQQCKEDALPPMIGAVLDGQPKFFLLEDLLPPSLRRRIAAAAPPLSESSGQNAPQPSRPASGGNGESRGGSTEHMGGAQAVAAPSQEFGRRLEEAFARLDRQHGGHNFVSLAELRRELASFERAEFDRHLRQLRIENRFALSGAQSKQGLSEDVREAGIHEAGHLLTYVSRRK